MNVVFVIDVAPEGSATLPATATAATAGETVEPAKTLAEAQVRELDESGYGCVGFNHYYDLPVDNLAKLILSIPKLTKSQSKFYVLGELAASLKPATGAGVQQKFRYIIGVSICQKVFIAVHGIKLHKLKSLQKQARTDTVLLPEHGQAHQAPHHLLAQVV